MFFSHIALACQADVSDARTVAEELGEKIKTLVKSKYCAVVIEDRYRKMGYC